MSRWLEVVIGALGSGALVGLLVGLVVPRTKHTLQRRRARAQDRDHSHAHARDRAQKRGHGEAEARTAWVARQREMCTALLDAVSRWDRLLLTFRSLHDLPASRLALQGQLEPELHQLPLLEATVRSFLRELDSESHADLQATVERFGVAALAYQEALLGPRSAQWHVVQRYIGTAPHEEVRRRAAAYDARRHELEVAVRAYVASLEAPPYLAAHRRPR